MCKAKLPQVALILYPDFQPLIYTIPQAVFSTAPEGKPLFALRHIAIDGQTFCSGAVSVRPDGGLELLQQSDVIIIPGWHDIRQPPCPSLVTALRRAYARGATLVGLCYGAYVLAYTGLLNDKKATTHWAGAEDFKRRFPAVQLDSNALYVEQAQLITSAGVAAGLDCCLAIVRARYGVKIANRIARLLVVAPHREGGQAQFIEQPVAQMTSHRSINRLLAEIQENPTALYHIDTLAKQLAMSRSTFTRHFRKATGMAFNHWLTEVRLQKGRDLLESSDLSIEQIAERIGYRSATAFRQQFKLKHQISPQAWRKEFQGN
ncbi:GlxA family transcriptional regulator [Necropsobacter massiliensis]|uniref:GlxA family transcriptional regulator n=1 Tax=Necropsobacter massiliensis TaxID=1400001 RepID=UPI000595DD73|nr:helix-turn-helix domain-containing protein [Necropsobacter massiliensis]